VLNGFNLELFEGETLVIMGKSGSGKSVMIKCLIGLEPHDSGKITIMGKNLDNMSEETLNEIRTEVGFLFQGSALYDSMSVRENLEFPLRRHTKKFGEIGNAYDLVMEALESVGLPNTMDLMPDELSGGEKQRVAIARALLNDPILILADEPTGNLDPETSNEILDILLKINKSGTAVLVATHNYDIVRKVNTRIFKIENGKAVKGILKSRVNTTQ
jgi:phospholipid/cholesterol/gamma-HCH transport system ATP-binding protein